MTFSGKIITYFFPISINEMARKFIIKEKEFHLGLPDIDKFSNSFSAQKVTFFFFFK